PQAAVTLCWAFLLAGGWRGDARQSSPPPDASPEALQMTPSQLDDLVAPIALYPDPLVAQILAASTYPMEVVAADRWLQANSGLQGAALTDAAKNQAWDPSVQALVVFPTVLSMMDKNLDWMTALGNAFLAQEQDVMNAIQRQRQRAVEAGKLESNAEQRVERSADGSVVIQPAQPEMMYVPVYDPVVVWGPPVYHPWPAFWYPSRPFTGAIIAGGLGGFFIGIPVANRFHHWDGWGGWGWGLGWRNRAVGVNNNFYVRNRYRPPPVPYRNGRGNWAHNPAHRAGVPYSSPAVANRVGARSTGIAHSTPQPGRGAAVRPLPAPSRPSDSVPPGGNAGIRPAPQPGVRAPVARPSPPSNRPGAPVPPGGNAGIRPAPQPGVGAPVARPSRPSNRPGAPVPPGGNAGIRPAPQPGVGAPVARPS